MAAKLGSLIMGVVLDSNILIYLLKGDPTNETTIFLQHALKHNVIISVITRMELLGWPGHTQETIHKTKALLDLMSEQPLDEPVIQSSIQLRCQHRIKLPDAIIAATAIILDLPLVTRNVNDFQNIINLKLINPFVCAN